MLKLQKDILDLLPHRPPFRFLSEILEVTDEHALGQWNLDGTEDFFAGHFPDQPLVPGVLITEAGNLGKYTRSIARICQKYARS